MIGLKPLKGGSLPFGDRSEYDYLLQIRVADGGENTSLKIAICTDKGLEFFEQESPFEHSFSASGYYIFSRALQRERALRQSCLATSLVVFARWQAPAVIEGK